MYERVRSHESKTGEQANEPGHGGERLGRRTPAPTPSSALGRSSSATSGIELGAVGPSRIVASTAIIQRVKVEVKGGTKEISELTPQEMLEYLKGYLFGGTIAVDAVADIQTWLKKNQGEDKVYQSIRMAYGKVNKAMPEAVKAFPAGTTVLTRSEIEAAAKSPGMIGKSPYVLVGTGSGLSLVTNEKELGWIRYNVVDETINSGKSNERKISVGMVQTINVKPLYQGLNLSRILMAAFCAKAMAAGATEYRLGTEDTSKGWWGQWGSRDLAKILARGDMQRIHLPTHVDEEAKANEAKEIEREKAEQAKKASSASTNL